jgi:hypothetical protein
MTDIISELSEILDDYRRNRTLDGDLDELIKAWERRRSTAQLISALQGAIAKLEEEE